MKQICAACVLLLLLGACAAPSRTDGAIRDALAGLGCEVVEIRDAAGRTVVRYADGDASLSYQRLALFDRESGELRPFAGGLVPEAEFAVAEDGAVLVLRPGTCLEDPSRLWPAVERWELPGNPADPPVSSVRPYLMPLDHGYSIGSHMGGTLERVWFLEDRVVLEFGDNGGLFVGGDPITPVTRVSFGGGICTVRLPGSILGEGLSPQGLWRAEDTREGAVIAFDCAQNGFECGADTRWYMEEDTHPATGLPFAAICFASGRWAENGGCPEGWLDSLKE